MAKLLYKSSRPISLIFSQLNPFWKTENCLKVATLPQATSCFLLQNRNSSFQTSNPVKEIGEYPEVEVIQNAPEWKYVEKLIASPLIPKFTPKTEYPSGWAPPKIVNPSKSKYFVARTKNHMIPVYLSVTYRGQRRMTIVRRIEGDIWKLEIELREIVEKVRKRLCASRVNEMSGQICFHGDYVQPIKNYLLEKGF